MDISTPHPALPSVATPSVLPSDAPTDGLSAWADIDLDAIRDNVARLGELAGDADVMAVIKGDAYGHGLVPVAEAAEMLGIAPGTVKSRGNRGCAAIAAYLRQGEPQGTTPAARSSETEEQPREEEPQ